MRMDKRGSDTVEGGSDKEGRPQITCKVRRPKGQIGDEWGMRLGSYRWAGHRRAGRVQDTDCYRPTDGVALGGVTGSH